MSPVITISTLPPPILQYFSSKLLSFPLPGMKEPEFYITRFHEKIEKKHSPGTNKHNEYLKLMEVYQELYEWKKIKEALRKSEEKESNEITSKSIETLHRMRSLLGRKFR